MIRTKRHKFIIRLTFTVLAFILITFPVAFAQTSERSVPSGLVENAINKGTKFLINNQTDEGFWSGSIPSTPGTTAINILALIDGGEDVNSSAVQKAVGWLISNQKPDGGWARSLNPSDESNLEMTSWVMVTLLRAGIQEDSKSIVDAKEFIHQHGGIENTSWFTKTIISKYGSFSVDSFEIPIPLEIILYPELFNETVTYYNQFYYLPVALVYYELKYPSETRSESQKAAIAAAIDWIKLHQSPDSSPQFVMALNSAGFQNDSPEIQYCVRWVLESQRGDGSWSGGVGNTKIFDTELAMISLSKAGSNHKHALEKAKNWLLAQQYTSKGPGWYYEGSWSWSYYDIPDADDTAYGVFALILAGEPSDSPAIVSALDFLRFFQNSDGGWPTFTKESYGIDGSLVDITTHVIEAFLAAGISTDDPSIQRGLMYIKKTQSDDGTWTTHWARNYTYGTYLGLAGLRISGENTSSPHVQKAVNWFKVNQNLDGGWGGIKGDSSTVEETSWALLALLTAGEDPESPNIQNGIKWLIEAQNPDGSWDYDYVYGIVFGDVSAFYADPMLPNTFAIRALTQYKELLNNTFE